MRNISDAAREVIRKLIVDISDFDDIRFPTSLCSNCHAIVYEYKRSNFKREIQIFDYSQLGNLRPLTRSNLKCMCLVCDIARASTTSNFGLSNSVIHKRQPGPT